MSLGFDIWFHVGCFFVSCHLISGFDPHDDSDYLTISGNEVYDNVNHGEWIVAVVGDVVAMDGCCLWGGMRCGSALRDEVVNVASAAPAAAVSVALGYIDMIMN